MNDKERLDFLDSMIRAGDTFTLRGQTLFTVQTQHQTVRSIREAVDLIRAYATGERCWSCENPGFGWKDGKEVRIKRCRVHNPEGQIALSDYLDRG